MAGRSEWPTGVRVRAVVWRHSAGAGVEQECHGNLIRRQTVFHADAVCEKGKEMAYGTQNPKPKTQNPEPKTYVYKR